MKITKIVSIINLLILFATFYSCQSKDKKAEWGNSVNSTEHLNLIQARKIFELPIHCLEVEYPNKLGQVIGGENDLKTPKSLRPIFYGCFDWHSSVHGYWSIVHLLKKFPELDQQGEVRELLRSHITKENLDIEMSFFNDDNNLSFERTYGWAWLFKLQQELLEWRDDDAQQWATVLQPLVDLLSQRTQIYLTKLVYPIRAGQHDNTAFSLNLMFDYATSVGDRDLLNSIIVNSERFYLQDIDCDLNYEPSGYDFLSPCLEEAHLMSKIMDRTDFKEWFNKFLPVLFSDAKGVLIPAIVADRTDGKLVHLDGLNFSRAHCLFGISSVLPELSSRLIPLADEHIQYSIDNISEDSYMGSHWLGTFALLALAQGN